MISTKELRDKVATLGSNYLTDDEWIEVIDRIEAAEQERDWHAERCEDALNECAALRAEITRVVALPARNTPEQALNMAINAGEHLRKHLPNDEFLTEADRMAVLLLEKAKRFERGDER